MTNQKQTPKEFLATRNLNKVNRKFDDYLSRDHRNYAKDYLCSVEYSHFANPHAVGYGLNGDPVLGEFTTQLIEAQQVLIHRVQGPNSDFMRVYLSSTSRSDDGGTFVEVRDPKGEKHFYHELNADRLRGWLDIETDEAEGLVSSLRWRGRDEFDACFEAKGWKVLQVFRYTHSFAFSPEYVQETKTSIEFGWMTNFTYYSHPNTLKITRGTGFRTVSLEEIGVEESGYYDHHAHIHIRPEQVKAVKAFNRRFKNKCKA